MEPDRSSVLAQRAASEGWGESGQIPSLATPPKKGIRNWKALARANGISQRASGALSIFRTLGALLSLQTQPETVRHAYVLYR
jgi:hypothetical protein